MCPVWVPQAISRHEGHGQAKKDSDTAIGVSQQKKEKKSQSQQGPRG